MNPSSPSSNTSQSTTRATAQSRSSTQERDISTQQPSRSTASTPASPLRTTHITSSLIGPEKNGTECSTTGRSPLKTARNKLPCLIVPLATQMTVSAGKIRAKSVPSMTRDNATVAMPFPPQPLSRPLTLSNTTLPLPLAISSPAQHSSSYPAQTTTKGFMATTKAAQMVGSTTAGATCKTPKTSP